MHIIDNSVPFYTGKPNTLDKSIRIPDGATVMRVYAKQVHGDGSVTPTCIVFEGGNPEDYKWNDWAGSNWKSLDWMSGH